MNSAPFISVRAEATGCSTGWLQGSSVQNPFEALLQCVRAEPGGSFIVCETPLRRLSGRGVFCLLTIIAILCPAPQLQALCRRGGTGSQRTERAIQKWPVRASQESQESRGLAPGSKHRSCLATAVGGSASHSPCLFRYNGLSLVYLVFLLLIPLFAEPTKETGSPAPVGPLWPMGSVQLHRLHTA
ncbi:unnamed protein product [Lampetra fluviatilis]